VTDAGRGTVAYARGMTGFGLEGEERDALQSGGGDFAAPTYDYAGWWVRVGAYLIDALLLFVGLVIVALIGGAISSTLGVILVIVWLAVYILGYWVYYEGSESGQTLGKRAVGIRVRDAGGGRASYGQAFGRNIVARVIGFIPLVGLIDVLWPLWDDRKQCLHDKAASTIVVRA
jgi:uncharacterized RDD family membrane protein YckC